MDSRKSAPSPSLFVGGGGDGCGALVTTWSWGGACTGSVTVMFSRAHRFGQYYVLRAFLKARSQGRALKLKARVSFLKHRVGQINPVLVVSAKSRAFNCITSRMN
jgi:hypothetical protein